MRVRLTGLGLLAVAGLLIATVVHRQARSNDASLDSAAGWGSARTGSESFLLADASDSFGASRKMLGSTSYAGTSSSSDASTPTDNSGQTPNSTASGNGADKTNPQSNSANPNGNSKQKASGDNSQAIFPSATFNSQSGNAQPGGSSRSRSASDAGDSTSSNSGLKALQQRLTSVRKSPNSPSAAGETRSSLVENPGVQVAPARSCRPIHECKPSVHKLDLVYRKCPRFVRLNQWSKHPPWRSHPIRLWRKPMTWKVLPPRFQADRW